MFSLKKIEGSNGFDIFRQLILPMEPALRNRFFFGILNAIMGWPQFVMKQGFAVSQLLKFEYAFRDYENTAGQALQKKNPFAVVSAV